MVGPNALPVLPNAAAGTVVNAIVMILYAMHKETAAMSSFDFINQ